MAKPLIPNVRLLAHVGCRITALYWYTFFFYLIDYSSSRHGGGNEIERCFLYPVNSLLCIYTCLHTHISSAESWQFNLFSFIFFFKVLQCVSASWVSAFPAVLCFAFYKASSPHQSFGFLRHFQRSTPFIFIKAHSLEQEACQYREMYISHDAV